MFAGGIDPAGKVWVDADTKGLLEGLSEGKIWVDHSTTDFGQTFEFEKAVRDDFFPLEKNVIRVN